ncbi:MAG: YesL family protein [Lachnospiraceae bacterium]|nr:YesL family protein [Lachnospiraceae bacterium]
MKFLNLDSPLMKFLSRMTDILWLNILTVVCSIPIVTAGASFTALHYVCLKMVRDEEGYITKDFFKSFKRNFKQATVIWLIMLAIMFVFYVDYKVLAAYTGAIPKPIILAGVIAAVVFLLFTGLYVFPVLSHFDNKTGATIKNAFFMSILALPRTILMVLLRVFPWAILYFVERFETASFLIPLTVLFWFSLPAYLSAKLYTKTFKRFEPETASTNDDFSWSVGGSEGTEETEGEKETLETVTDNSDKTEE